MNDIIEALLQTIGGQAKNQLIGKSTKHIQDKGDNVGDWVVKIVLTSW